MTKTEDEIASPRYIGARNNKKGRQCVTNVLDEYAALTTRLGGITILRDSKRRNIVLQL